MFCPLRGSQHPRPVGDIDATGRTGYDSACSRRWLALGQPPVAPPLSYPQGGPHVTRVLCHATGCAGLGAGLGAARALSLAGAQPPPPLPARLLMDPPTQAELDAQAALLPAGVAPLIRGSVFYDQDGDADPGSPQCDRGRRDLTVTLYQDVGVYRRLRTRPRPSGRHDRHRHHRQLLVRGAVRACRLPGAAGPGRSRAARGRWPPRPTRSPWRWRPAKSKTANLGVRVRETAAVRDVVLSEIAWAGTAASTFAALPGFDPETSSDEWIELRNTTARTVDLTGWTLTAADGTPSIALRGRIPPHGYYLLERTDDGSAPAATADQIYTGALENKPNDEDLTLSDGVTAIDRVDAWYAGDTAFHTMQRVDVTLPGTDPAAWADGPIDGAPQNSLVDVDADTYFFSPNLAQAAQSLDCDDTDAGIHPGAAEILDLVDQDCDHQVDEGLTLEPYAGARATTPTPLTPPALRRPSPPATRPCRRSWTARPPPSTRQSTTSVAPTCATPWSTCTTGACGCG